MIVRDGDDIGNPSNQQLPMFINKKRSYRKVIIVALLAISLLLTNEIWISFSAINISAMNYFNKSATSCEWFSAVFFVTFAFQAIPSIFVPQLIGIKRCIISGTILILIGCILRAIAFLPGYTNGTGSKYTETSFWLVMLGNVIVSFSQCLLKNIPSLVSAVFFEEHQLLISTSLIMNGSIIGTAMGFVFAPLIMNETEDMQKMQKKFLIITGTESVLSSVVFIITMIVIPTSGYMPDNNLIDNEENDSFKKTLKFLLSSITEALQNMWLLLKSFTFVVLFIIYGLYYSMASIFCIILSNIITENLGSNANTLISYCGSFAVIVGAIFSAALCVLIGKWGSFKVSIWVSSLLMFLSAAPLFVTFILSHYKIHNRVSIVTLTISYGIAAAPYMSLGYDIMSKASAPTPANIPVTMALIFSNVFSVALYYISLYMPKDKRNQIFLMAFGCIYIAMGFVHFFVKVKQEPTKSRSQVCPPNTNA